MVRSSPLRGRRVGRRWTVVWWWRRRRGGSAPARHGGTYRSDSGIGTRFTRTSTAGLNRASGHACSRRCSLSRSRLVTWTGSPRSTRRSFACTSMGRRFRATQGAPQNYKKFGDEPPDHAIGRSRGGLTTKNHLVCDGKGRALAFILTPGQTADTIMLAATLEQIRVPAGRGRPRTRPDRVMADKGYPSRANRAWLRTRGIAGSRRRSRNATIRSLIVVNVAGGRSTSATSSAAATAAATLSSDASTSSSNGGASR